MLAFLKNFRVFNRFLVALFVFSAITTAGAAESHRNSEASEHAGHLSMVADGATDAGGLTQSPMQQDTGHADHCTFDALCVTGGAWSVSGQHMVMPPARVSTARLIPRTAFLKGLRPRPELRPPRHDS